MLLIFDNCDDFIAHNKTTFELNLEFWEKQANQLSIIFISEDKLDDSFAQGKL